MSEATNALASSVHLSSIQSLVDLLVELPLPSESPEVVAAAARLAAPEQREAVQVAASSVKQQLSLSQSLVAAMKVARQQLDQLNVSFQQRKRADDSRGDASLSYSRLHKENAYLLSLLQQNDALCPAAAVPPVIEDSKPRPETQQWDSWQTGAHESVTQVTPHQSPHLTSPSYPIRSSVAGQTTVVYNDSSNSSSSFSADPVTPSAMATTPTYQQAMPQPQQQQQLFSQPAPLQPASHAASEAGDQPSEPVVVLERCELVEKALKDYYASASNGSADACP